MKDTVKEYLEFSYKKIRLVKRSERGEVWLAQENSTNRLVIIKIVQRTNLPYAVIQNSDFKLPAKVFYCFEDENETVIVEEFIQGENLHERLEEKNFLTEPQAREILLQMCDGLSELHAKKIIHRDIKPANLILQGGKIRLIDFDAARIFKAGQEVDTNPLGTKGYAPPEQFGSGQTDPRSDIYALGKTIEFLLGGNCGGLKKILDKCTELDPKNRFQNVDELKIALTSAKKFRYIKIFAAIIFAAGIFFVNASSLNFDEKFSETVAPRAKRPQSEENSPQTPAEPFKFREINLSPNEPEPIEIPEPKETSPTEKNSPTEPFKFQEINLPPTEPESIEIPEQEEIEQSPEKNSSGMIRTEFFFNGEPYDQFEHLHENMPITREQWRQSGVRLRITNDTGKIWREPTIKYKLGHNWGGGVTEKKTLPDLADGDSAEFEVPFDFEVSDRQNTQAYVQIWLDGDEKKLDEHYWSIRFEIID